MLGFSENNQKGFVASIITFLVLLFMLSLAISMLSVIIDRHKITENVIKATQSYYTAEAGIEDSALRLKNNPMMLPSSYSLDVGGSVANIEVPSAIGGSRSIISQGNYDGRIKKVRVVYSIGGTGVSFHYGVQVGEGGMQMSNNSRVIGNVFSDGNITGSGIVDDNVIVAGNNGIDGLSEVKGNVLAYSCRNSTIDGGLTYVTGGSVENCNVYGETSTQSDPVPIQPMPISGTQIQDWKDEASEEIITGNVSILNGQTRTMGPVKIIGSLTVSNNATLKLAGTIYVTGSISVSINSVIRLDNSYGSMSGVILADGQIAVGNNSVFSGSSQEGSYILVLSTSPSDSAISVSNNAAGAIFYTTSGGILLSNNVSVREATGYKITLSNNAIVQYDSGLENTFFSSGPGGGWEITSWKEE